MSDATVAYEVVVKEVVVDVVVGEVIADELVVDEVVATVVLPDADVADPNPYVTSNTKITTSSIEPPVHTNRAFPRGPIDRSMLT